MHGRGAPGARLGGAVVASNRARERASASKRRRLPQSAYTCNMQQRESDGSSIDVPRRHGLRRLLQVSLIVCMLVLVNGQPRPAAWNFLTGIADKTAAVTQAVTDSLLPNLGRRTMSPVRQRHAMQAAAVRQVHAPGVTSSVCAVTYASGCALPPCSPNLRRKYSSCRRCLTTGPATST